MPAEIKSVPCPRGLVHILGESIPLVPGTPDDGWVVLKPLCERVGLNWSGERSRLKHDAKFTPVMMPLLGVDKKRREMLCLPLSQLHGWLLSINGARVDEGLCGRVQAYQQESLVALNEYWSGVAPIADVAASPGPAVAPGAEPTGESSMATLESKVKNVMRDLLGDFAGGATADGAEQAPPQGEAIP